MNFTGSIELVGKVIDTAGVAVLLTGTLLAAERAIRHARAGTGQVYQRFRRQLGQSIPLGLELLVAADIIRTVAVTPTLTTVRRYSAGYLMAQRLSS